MTLTALFAMALMVSASGVALPGDPADGVSPVPDSTGSDLSSTVDPLGESLPGAVEALDGAHCRGGQQGEVAVLLDGVPITSPISRTPLLLVPAAALENAGSTGFADPTGLFSGLSGSAALVTREADAPGVSGTAGFGTGSMEIDGMQPLWHPSLPSHETRPLLEDCYTASAMVEGASGAVLPGLSTVLVSGDFVSSAPSAEDDGSWRSNWDNNAYESWSGLVKLGWIRSPSLEAGLTFALHERERGWSDWAWRRFETPYIDEDTTSPGYGDTLSAGTSLEYALPTRFDDGSLASLEAALSMGGAGRLDLFLAMTGSHIYDRIRDEDGGFVGDLLETGDDWEDFNPPERLVDAEGFYRSGLHDLLWYDFEDDAASAGLSWSMDAGMHSLSAGTGWTMHEMEETSVSLLDSQTVTAWRNWEADPLEGAVFARDGIDLSNGLRAAAGLRLGCFDPRFDFTRIPDPIFPGSNTGGPLPGGSLCTEAPAKTWLDPSISVVQSLGAHHSISLEYAHVSRMPRSAFLYPNTDSVLIGENPFVGNPDLDPERSVNIRLGFDRVCPGRGAMGVSLFHRTMDDLITTETRQDPGQGYYRQFVNGASATVQGVEISQHARYSDWLAWAVGYSLSRAEGTWSILQEDQEYEWSTPWISGTDEFPLAWDRRHSLVLSLSGEFPQRAGIAGGLGAGLEWTYASGFPFDTSYFGTAPAERNTGRYPDATRLDASVWRRQSIGGVDLTLKLDVVNLSQERNIAWIVDPEWYLAEVGGGYHEMDPTGPLHNSHAFGPPRHFYLGLSMDW